MVFHQTTLLLSILQLLVKLYHVSLDVFQLSGCLRMPLLYLTHLSLDILKLLLGGPELLLGQLQLTSQLDIPNHYPDHGGWH